jgi:hypothetical protein
MLCSTFRNISFDEHNFVVESVSKVLHSRANPLTIKILNISTFQVNFLNTEIAIIKVYAEKEAVVIGNNNYSLFDSFQLLKGFKV